MSHLTVLLSFLILSFLSTSGNNEALTVTQTPLSITVKEGETAHMQCCWGGVLHMERVQLKWNKENTSNGDIIDILHVKQNETHEVKTDKYASYVSGNCSEFNISSVSTNDTGVFICKITMEIPFYQRRQGPGTQLTVERTNNSSTAAESSEPIPLTTLLIPLAVSMGALSLCAFLCYWRKKKLMPYPGQATGRVGMVIHEVPHGEGEDEGEVALAENEDSTRSSDGSTQWCAVPVYESFDYFAVQNSKDG